MRCMDTSRRDGKITTTALIAVLFLLIPTLAFSYWFTQSHVEAAAPVADVSKPADTLDEIDELDDFETLDLDAPMVGLTSQPVDRVIDDGSYVWRINELTTQVKEATATAVSLRQQLADVAAQRDRLQKTVDRLNLRPERSSTVSVIDSDLKSKRMWTAVTGQSVEATFVGIEDNIVLLSAKGKTFRIPINQLAASDQRSVAQMALR